MEQQHSTRARLCTLIVGGGPAGLGLLMAARNKGTLADLLTAGVAVVERTASIGAGELGDYIIRSDSWAHSFLKAVDVQADPSLDRPRMRKPGTHLQRQRHAPVELPIVGEFLVDVAAEFRRQVRERCDTDPFLTGLEARRAVRQRDGSWVTECRRADGTRAAFNSRTLVLTTGAHQPPQRLLRINVAGAPLLPRYEGKTVQSGEFLTAAGLRKCTDLLRAQVSPKVAIVGGSHSALAAALLCLTLEGVAFAHDAVTVLHRGDLRVMYASPADAHADGFHSFFPDDICAKTGRVFPLAGFRCDSRDLLRQAWGLDTLPPDPRLRFWNLRDENHAEANKILDDADLIIAALGYRPRALPLFDEVEQPLALLADVEGGPLVDQQSRVLDANARPIPGVFAMGLAAGYPLAGTHGESSFRGQANGLALWHGEIGEQMVIDILDHTRQPREMRGLCTC